MRHDRRMLGQTRQVSQIIKILVGNLVGTASCGGYPQTTVNRVKRWQTAPVGSLLNARQCINARLDGAIGL